MENKPQKRHLLTLKAIIMLVLIVFMMVSAFTLLHVSDNMYKSYLMIGIICDGVALCVMIISSDTSLLAKKKREQNPVNPQSRQNHLLDPHQSSSDNDKKRHLDGNNGTVDYSWEKKVYEMIKLLECNHIKPFKDSLSNTQIPDERVKVVAEQLLDIAFLSMDIARISTTVNCAHEEAINNLLLCKQNKNAVFNQLDRTITPPMYIRNLQRIMAIILPDTSFFYSSYKI